MRIDFAADRCIQQDRRCCAPEGHCTQRCGYLSAHLPPEIRREPVTLQKHGPAQVCFFFLNGGWHSLYDDDNRRQPCSSLSVIIAADYVQSRIIHTFIQRHLYAIIRMETKKLIEDAEKYLMHTYSRFPVVLRKGRGMRVWEPAARSIWTLSAALRSTFSAIAPRKSLFRSRNRPSGSFMYRICTISSRRSSWLNCSVSTLLRQGLFLQFGG